MKQMTAYYSCPGKKNWTLACVEKKGSKDSQSPVPIESTPHQANPSHATSK